MAIDRDTRDRWAAEDRIPTQVTITLDTPDADRLIELAQEAAFELSNLPWRAQDKRIVRDFAQRVAQAKADGGRVFRQGSNL